MSKSNVSLWTRLLLRHIKIAQTSNEEYAKRAARKYHLGVILMSSGQQVRIRFRSVRMRKVIEKLLPRAIFPVMNRPNLYAYPGSIHEFLNELLKAVEDTGIAIDFQDLTLPAEMFL